MSSDAPIAVAFFISTASVVWSAAYAWTRWLVRPNQEPDMVTRGHQFQLEQRMTEIERAVQSIVAEVERLSDSQRLSSRLLAERLPAIRSAPRLPGETPRMDTPH
jgi:hypothetical protein